MAAVAVLLPRVPACNATSVTHACALHAGGCGVQLLGALVTLPSLPSSCLLDRPFLTPFLRMPLPPLPSLQARTL